MFLRNCCTFAVVSAFLFAGASRSSATLMYDLRLHTGGGKSITVQKGDHVDLDLYAVVTGTNGAIDEGYQFGYGSFLATGNSIKGGLTLNIQSAFGQGFAGTPANLDGDTFSNDIGSNAGAPDGNFVLFRSGMNPVTTGNPLVSGQGLEFLVATLIYSVDDIFTLNGQVSINYRAARWANPPAEAAWQEDGNPVSSNGATALFLDGNPVIIKAIPEPATVALLAVGCLAACVRRRRRS